MSYSLRLLAIALIAALGVVACGQKGPLYLPGNPSEIRPEPPEEQQDDDEDDEDEEPGSSNPR